MKKSIFISLILVFCFLLPEVKAQIIIDGSGLRVNGALSSDQFMIDDIIHGAIPADLWIGQSLGYLQSCDGSGACTSHGDQGDPIFSMTVFNGRLWIGQSGGELQSCDSSGACTSHGDQGDPIYAMTVFNGRLWIGQSGGELQSCDSSGNCTSHGDQGDLIFSMAVFNGRLWIGRNSGLLHSYDGSGDCISHGDQGYGIRAMAVFNGLLWIGQSAGELQSCGGSGDCTSHGDQGNGIYAMTVFNDRLWLGHNAGELRSCDGSGYCTNHYDKGNTILAMTVFSGRLWIGQDAGFLQSCDSLGACTNHGDQDYAIYSMTVFNPASLGNTIYTQQGYVGINMADPNDALDVVGDVDATGCYETDNGVLVGGTCISDVRLKKNIKPMEDSLHKICKLKPVTYEYREHLDKVPAKSGAGVGLIAQEVKKVLPQLVKTDEKGYKRVVYGLELQMHMIAAIRELKAEMDAIKAENDRLKKQVYTLTQ